MYNNKVMEIFKNPKNMGELKGANGIGTVGNVACGDIMKIYLKINENGIIEDASFKTFGCVAAIVSSSIATEMIKGMTIEQALKLDNDKIIAEVGELPVHKIHCSVLAKEAIENAVADYNKRIKREQKRIAKGKTIVKENKTTAKKEIEKPALPTTEEKTKMTKNINQANKIENLNKKLASISAIKDEKTTKIQLPENKTSKKNNTKKLDKNFALIAKKLNKLEK